MNIAPALLFLAALLPAGAQDGDPLKSPACGAALADLQAARAAGTGAAAVETLRAGAASVCLGSAAVPQRPGRLAQPPVAVPAPQVEVPARAAPLPPPAAPLPPVAIERPAVPATCDANGCWTTDGTHLRHVPPGQAGPRGVCTQQGGLVVCP